MSSICGESMVDFDGQDSSAHDEKIFVAIRLRPLNERELSKNDVSEWECINNTTVLFKNTLQERTMQPAAYTFDRVFGCDSPTRQVYDESAKKIALSVLNGMNSTIFAYGQTSSGKTYTMSGITEYTIADIYDYINMHPEREFILKFSAMEIYNEAVRDLLVLEGGPLRLLDDPERGTVVDKLTEVMVTDCNHLRELLSICEAQRQNGETTLNEVSSRSHQILRLTVESEARGYHGAGSSSLLTASVSFVDLAGSERASQTLSAGTRLKEGCHINRSLLSLGTVIRKLSKGRNAHIPYRDSKLTRILQNSLGGNARTAIICTMSPAHTHLEQSRNTLLFASCAKQVSTNAQVNVVMSEKALVKQLQKELARLENELRKLSSVASTGGSSSALKEKELLIEKMDKEIKELIHQRDLAQSRAEDMLRSASSGGYHASKYWVDMHHHDKASWASEYAASEASDIIDPFRSDVASRTSHISERYEGIVSNRIEYPFPENNEEQFLSGDTSPRLYIDKYFGPDPCQGWEKIASQENNNKKDNCKEVKCIEIDFTKRNITTPQKGDQVSGCNYENTLNIQSAIFYFTNYTLGKMKIMDLCGYINSPFEFTMQCNLLVHRTGKHISPNGVIYLPHKREIVKF
ncbi:kinesin-like protein nack1 [Phtheirospermum japonicum]|uniref:Kinesin-like protein n=1 Tax=Phtheirospermum japonicum TaxID=374723 RepID=A0A830C387_9LAMI|nr:kinesin-like protein nack1 [Phtheirospermum japonicum]